MTRLGCVDGASSSQGQTRVLGIIFAFPACRASASTTIPGLRYCQKVWVQEPRRGKGNGPSYYDP